MYSYIYYITLLLLVTLASQSTSANNIVSFANKHRHHHGYHLYANSNTNTQLFEVDVGGYNNYFYRDSNIACQVLFTNGSSNLQRFIAAFPNGNSGAMMYFKSNSSSLAVTLQNNTLQSITDTYNRSGITGIMNMNSNATLGVAILGGTRTVCANCICMRMYAL